MTRFATAKYDVGDLSNIFIHLTNFTFYKSGEMPTDYPAGMQANKWTIPELWKYLEEEHGVEPGPFWEQVKDIVIKTILCGHNSLSDAVSQNMGSTYNNFNILGLDIFMDTDFK